jgi:hypothetical protein
MRIVEAEDRADKAVAQASSLWGLVTARFITP